jgi:hypothetical protein
MKFSMNNDVLFFVHHSLKKGCFMLLRNLLSCFLLGIVTTMGLFGCSSIAGLADSSNEGTKTALVGVDQNNLGSKLQAGQQLVCNQYLLSPNGLYKLILQTDGNLVIYNQTTNKAVWATYTNGKPVVKAVMQGDGNFVLYGSNGASYWSSRTYNYPGAFLQIQDQGNAVVYAKVQVCGWVGQHFICQDQWVAKWWSSTGV